MDAAVPIIDFTVIPPSQAAQVWREAGLPSGLVPLARNVDGDMLVAKSDGAVCEWDADTKATGGIVASRLGLLLEALRDKLLSGHCELVEDCFMECQQ